MATKMTTKDVAALIGSVVLAEAAGGIGTMFTIASIPTWYATLQKPFFSPPNWLFGPVWTILYALMGIAAFLVWWHRKQPGATKALWIYLVHLAVNALWSILFFGLKNIGLAFMEILILWAMIIALIVLFRRYDKHASCLLVPYLLWVSFATVLNGALWMLNSSM